jgi:pimeloyl-ACP methyl ester carboxylesterase
MRFLKRLGIGLISIVIVAVLVFYFGPRASFDEVNPDLPSLTITLSELDGYLSNKEVGVVGIKPENASRVIWADSVKQTEYAIVYLHGFSAGPMEGAPLHMEMAKRYGMNLYLPRLRRHGIDDKDIFAELTPAEMMDDAKEALTIGRKLGKKVILMSCSTGSTLGVYLSAFHQDIFAHIMYSPNIALYNPTGKMLTGPWGLQIAKKVVGEYKVPDAPKKDVPDSVQAKIDQYWTGTYRVEGLVALQALIDMTMKDEVFNRVNQPYFMGFYYKNDSLQDMTVSVDAILDFDSKTKTSDQMKRVVAFKEAGAHVINSPLISKEYAGVKAETIDYLEKVLGFEPYAKAVEK